MVHIDVSGTLASLPTAVLTGMELFHCPKGRDGRLLRRHCVGRHVSGAAGCPHVSRRLLGRRETRRTVRHRGGWGS